MTACREGISVRFLLFHISCAVSINCALSWSHGYTSSFTTIHHLSPLSALRTHQYQSRAPRFAMTKQQEQTPEHQPSMIPPADADVDTVDEDDLLPSVMEQFEEMDALINAKQPLTEQESATFGPGVTKGYTIVKHYPTPATFDVDAILYPNKNTTHEDNDDNSKTNRLGLTPTNITLPLALMMLDPKLYPSLSRARKACRKSTIVIQSKATSTRLDSDPTDTDTHSDDDDDTFDLSRCSLGKVISRIQPGDVIGVQERRSHGAYSEFIARKNTKTPTFNLPVMYEDDSMAIVNKPAGVLVYDVRNVLSRRDTILFSLPYVLKPPLLTQTADVNATAAVYRPSACHRLDKPTCGLLVVGKSKPAVVHICKQFMQREVLKTYTAILNGKLTPSVGVATTSSTSNSDGNQNAFIDRNAQESVNETGNETNGTLEKIIPPVNKFTTTIISNQEAYEMGFDVDPTTPSPQALPDNGWYLASDILDGKEAVTAFRIVSYHRSNKAQDSTFDHDKVGVGCLTLVELKPKTGRFHQLRRQMSLRGTPIVGDTTYGDSNKKSKAAHKRFGRGLMLCSNKVIVAHPFYNTEEGRLVWQDQTQLNTKGVADAVADDSQIGTLWERADGVVMVTVDMEPPPKFQGLLKAEEQRANMTYEQTKKTS